MNVRDLAKLLRQCKSSIQRKCVSGEIPAIKKKSHGSGAGIVWDIPDSWIKKLLKGEIYGDYMGKNKKKT